MEFLNTADFWIGLVKIVWINIILSGDNAVVMPSRNANRPSVMPNVATAPVSVRSQVRRASSVIAASEIAICCATDAAAH